MINKSWIKICIACLTVLTFCQAQEVIAKDSLGMIVEVKEKYGGLLYDTCTVVMYYSGQFVLVKKTGRTGWYPASFHSVRILEKENKDD